MDWAPLSHHAFRWLVTLVALFAVAAAETRCGAQEREAERALKYHKLLLSRPEPGYLFDRFYNTWLDESTVDALEKFLTSRAQESHATPDQLLLAFFYVKKGDDVAALEQFQQALAANPASAATWYYKALVEARTLDFDSAIAELKKAREQSPDDKLAVQIDRQLGKWLVRNRKTAEALAIWQALIQAHPDDDDLCEDLIDLHMDEGLLKEASQLTETLIARTKDPYLIVMRRLRLGDIRNRAGNREQAIADYTSALDSVGNESWLEREILAQLEQVYRREDDVAGLKKLYDDLVAKYPKRIAVRRRQAQLLVEQGEHEPAIAAFREVMKLTPGDRATREEFIAMLTKIGKHDEAVTELKSMCEQYPKDSELRFRLANLLHEAKKPDEAIAAAQEYLTVSDGSEYAYLRAARLLERFESKDAAAKVYADLAAKFADSASAQEAYAAFLYSSDKKEDALARWRALAEKADVAQVLHVARALGVRNEHQAVFDMLKQRQAEFTKEPLHLGQLVTTAFALKKYDDAIPWALARVELAESASDLETAVDQAAMIVEKAEKLDDVSKELESRERRSIPETCLLAELLERAGNGDRADAVLKGPAADGNLLVLSEQIRIFSQRREWSAAADATRRILDSPDGRKSLYVRRLIELYQRDFQLEEALKWVDEWKRLSPGSTTPWVTEARLLSGLSKTDDALKVLRTAVLRFEEDEELRVRLAEFYTEANKPADAERIYWQLYEQTEDMSDKLRWAQELAKLAQQQGTIEQLVDNFNERAASNRRSIVPQLSLAEVYRQTDDYEGRRRALTAASKIKPDDIFLLQQIARVAEQDGDWKAAIATLERAIPLDKTNRTREQIAQIHLRNGDEETGLALLMDLTTGTDADPRTIESFADTLCGMQEWERAADFLQKRLVDFPEDYRLRYLMAVAMEEAGQSNSALEQFVQLMDGQQELPAKTKKGSLTNQQGLSNSYYDMLKQLLPAQASQWFEVMQCRYTAYSHRQSGGIRLALSGGGTARSAIQLPSSVDMVRPMALSHALGVTATLEEEQQQDANRLLEAHDIQDVEAWTKIDPMRGDFTPAITELLDRNPDNETALAILVLQRIGRPDVSLAPHCVKALEKFRESRPQLALMAAVQAGAGGADDADVAEAPTEGAEKDAAPGKPNKYLDEALEIASTLDKPNPMVVMAITYSLGGFPGAGGQSQVDQAYRQKFSRLLVKWYPSLNNSPWGSYAFYMVVGSLGQDENPATYVQFLDDEVSRSQVGGGGSNSRQLAAQMGAYRGNQQTLLTPLSFPPTQLAEFPASVLMIFSANENNNPFGGRFQAPGTTEDSQAKLKPLLEKVKSPILRILLAHSAEDEAQLDEGIAKLLAAKTPSVDAYLLAAGRATEQENHKEVVGLLGKARYLPMNPTMRQTIDAAIVAAVIELKAGSTPLDPELLEAGQQASLRLRRARLDAQQRTELIAAMEELGLKKEAKKLDELASQTPSLAATIGRAVVSYSTGSPTNSQDRAAKLAAEGKSEAAAKLLASDVSSQVQQVMNNPGMGRSFSYQYRQLKRRIDGLGLTDAVIKALDPGDTKNYRKINEYAMALEVFGRNDEARAQYQRVLEMRPKDDFARMQLILLLADSDPAVAADEIKKLAPTSRDAFGQMLTQQFQDYEMPIAERVASGAIAAEFIKSLKPGDISQPYWIENIVNSLGRQMSTNRGEGLPSLYQRKDAENSRNRRRGASDEVIAKRAQVHRELCLALLENSDFARTGFRHLLAATEAKGESTDEFAERAHKVLLDEAAERSGRGNAAIVNQAFYSGDSQEQRFESPEEFLAARAWKSGDWSLIDDTILPKLTAGRVRQSREKLERMSGLYRCESGEFAKRAEDVIRDARATSQQGENEGLAIVVDVWAARELDVDLREMVLKQLKLDASHQNHYRAPTYLTNLIVGGAKKWDREKQLDFLDEVATIYIAPPGKRNDFLQKNYQRNQINWGTPSGRIYVYRQFMEQVCQNSDLLFTVLEHLQQFEQPPVENLEYRARDAVVRAVSKGPEATLAFLDRSPWLQDLPQFRPLANGIAGPNAPLMALVQQLIQQGDQKSKLREMLEERQKNQPTFGGGFILACLDQPEKPNSTIDYLAANLVSIRALPDEKQVELASGIYDVIRKDRFVKKDLSVGAKAAQQWLESQRVGKSQNLLARLEKAKKLEELGIQYGNVDDFLRESIAGLMRSDTSTAVKVFLRLGDLARDAQRRNEWHMYFGNGNSTDGWMLQQMMYGIQEKDWAAYNFVADLVRNDKNRPIELDNAVTQAVSQAINSSLDHAPKLANGQTAPIDARVRTMYEEFGESLGGRPASLFFDGFQNQVGGQLSLKDCEAIRKWAQEESQGGKYPALAADLDAVVALISTEKGADRNSRLGPGQRRPMADYHEHFAKILDDGELPLSWRLYVAENLVRRHSAALPLELAIRIVPLYSQALSNKVPITGSQNDQLMKIVVSLTDEASAKELLVEWGDKWAGRYLGPARPQTNNQRNYERLDEPANSQAIWQALEVYYAIGSTERATTLLRKYDGQIGNAPQSFAVLVRAQQPAEAAKLIRGNWQTLRLDWPSLPLTRYDDKFAESVQAVYEKLDRDDERYFAELFFASAPDVDAKSRNNGDAQPAAIGRDERLKQLAERFPDVEFANPALKKRSLVILSLCKATRDSVADRLAEQYKVENVVTAIQSQENQTATQETQLATCHIGNRLRQGDSKPLVELLHRLSRNPENNDYQFGQRVMPFITCLRDALNESGQPWPEAECAAIAAPMRDFFKNRDYVYFNDYQVFNSLFVALHGRGDSRDPVSKWWNELSDNSRNQMKNRGIRDDVWKFGLRLIGPPTPENVDDRVKFVKSVLGIAVDLDWVRWNRNQQYYLVGMQGTPLFSTVVRSGMLTNDELMEHGESLVGDINNVPLVTAAWAEWLLSNHEYKRAVANWQWVIDNEVKPDDKKPSEQKVNYVLKLAQSLKSVGKPDAAEAALATLDGKEIPGSMRGAVTRTKKEIEDAGKKAENTDQVEKPQNETPAERVEAQEPPPAQPPAPVEKSDSKSAAWSPIRPLFPAPLLSVYNESRV